MCKPRICTERRTLEVLKGISLCAPVALLSAGGDIHGEGGHIGQRKSARLQGARVI